MEIEKRIHVTNKLNKYLRTLTDKYILFSFFFFILRLLFRRIMLIIFYYVIFQRYKMDILIYNSYAAISFLANLRNR